VAKKKLRTSGGISAGLKSADEKVRDLKFKSGKWESGENKKVVFALNHLQ
jgi:hypothetical protein